MPSKAQRTAQFIIEKAAPLFNTRGYAGTSMNDITRATGLTKGAIYGNFDNKEEIAIAAFNRSVNDLLSRIGQFQRQSDSPIGRLHLIAAFYRSYYDYSRHLGGCPILNVGVDSNHQHPALLARVQYIIQKTQHNIARQVEQGKRAGEIRPEADSVRFARDLYTRIQGAVFMSHTMNDRRYLLDAADDIDHLIDTQLRS